MGKLIVGTAMVNDISQLHNISDKLLFDEDSVASVSNDFGNLVLEVPSAVLHPSSIADIIDLIKFSNKCSTPFGVSARGCGHSVRGQAAARGGGVVVDMSSLRGKGIGVRVSWDPSSGHYYADAGGEQLWMDVLRAALEHGLAPVSWTDYLYLSVGGTLSNGGISGQSFLHGPQITNVLELDVITGKGDLLTCSHHINSDLFFAVLGGLGQFGIITRARIILHKAPTRAKWVRLLYSDFSTFTRDQEHLISCKKGPDYVEGSLITPQSPPNNWRSSFYSSSQLSKITSFLKRKKNGHGLLYSIEFVKYYDKQTADTIDEEIEAVVEELNFIPGLLFMKDVPLVDFLGRVKRQDTDRSEGQLEETHPWLNLFVPKSRILDFNAGVFVDIIARHNLSSGPILFYPSNKKKWDCRMSAVVPDEDVFYTLGLLHSSTRNDAEYFDELNNEIIEFCEKSGIEIKQYLPHYKSREDWMKHFGPRWETFQETKNRFDPRMILSPGQRIFND
ncbi:cytokinin dehydrogenase 3-like [Andrographis paniculata]|uniref:cytokinin dehydrogenase 3-like n=1 Tax=Andrographis paniculata TaxID=175694 RepID=UPI0021E8649F|nr:cytokinin dehydrogenase 3-like [Andrographis paniculata]